MKKAIFLILFFIAGQMHAQNCGVWRWDVKTLVDDEGTQLLSKTPIAKSIDALSKEIAPQKLSTHSNFSGRLSGEHDLITADAVIIEYKLEADHDYHIVLQDPNTNATIVSEIPDPNCPNLANSPDLQQRYAALRAWIDSKVRVTTSMTTADPAIPIKVVGVAFWDAPHGATGASNQGREIHPITDIIADGGSVLNSSVTPSNTPPAEVDNSDNSSAPVSFIKKPVAKPSVSSASAAGNDPSTIFINLLLGAFLGMLGQGLRVFAGINKANNDPNNAGKSTSDILQLKQLIMSFLYAFIIGALTGSVMAIDNVGKSWDKSMIMAIIAAGYAGTDFLEGFLTKNFKS